MSERGSDFKHSTMRASTIFRSAAEFGLTPEEICQTVAETLDRLPSDTAVVHSIDELAGTLARRLLERPQL